MIILQVFYVKMLSSFFVKWSHVWIISVSVMLLLFCKFSALMSSFCKLQLSEKRQYVGMLSVNSFNSTDQTVRPQLWLLFISCPYICLTPRRRSCARLIKQSRGFSESLKYLSRLLSHWSLDLLNTFLHGCHETLVWCSESVRTYQILADV